MQSKRTHQGANEFVVFQPDGSADLRPVKESFWVDLHRDYPDFHGHVLVSTSALDADWGSWERHPHGDEYVYLLHGKVEMTLALDRGEEATLLDTPGQFLLIPRGVWHTARVLEPGRMLFVTPGHATEHREIGDS